ncbi:MAG: Nif3-like dinuclear metal center hexameric protein [Candidatus Parcubacteria bacterium]|nr:Nif3-like dinuclear metal center hexameric protein [Candidatus Parcubacteria bacterium]
MANFRKCDSIEKATKTMEKLEKIVKFLDKYLKIRDIKDITWNGLQVEGNPNVNQVVFTENASLDTFKMALKEKADLIVVHHGHFWKEENPSLIKDSKERVEFLLKNGISLYVAHLPLDRHKEVGNNAQLLKLLGAKIKSEFSVYKGKNVGWIGEFSRPLPVGEIVKKINSKLNTNCKTLLFGKNKIKTIAVCSGGGNYKDFNEAIDKEVDLYLTGDAIDIYPSTKDAKFNVIFAGHYATETVGVNALMKVVGKRLKIETTYIDDPTGL